MRGLINYLGEVREEMTKVVWPKRDDVVRLTFVVIIISLIVGVYVGALDFALTKALEFVVSR